MKSLYENRYIRDKAVVKEIYGYTFFRRPVLMVLDIIMAVLFVISLVRLITGTTDSFVALIAAGVFYLYRFLSYESAVHRNVKLSEKAGKDGLKVTVFITDTELINRTSAGKEVRTDLTEILSGHRTKHLILLTSRKNVLYVLRRDGFTNGTEDDFIAFLKGRGVLIR